MKPVSVYRVLTFILIPIAAMFGFMDLLFLISALANPAMLLIVFMFAAFVIYTFACLKFLGNGIDTGRPCKPSLRDWIKVNAYVSLFLGAMFFINANTILFMGETGLNNLIGQLRDAQPNMPARFSNAFFVTLLRGMSWFLLVVSIVLLTHIFLNFRVLKMYAHLFSEEKQEQ